MQRQNASIRREDEGGRERAKKVRQGSLADGHLHGLARLIAHGGPPAHGGVLVILQAAEAAFTLTPASGSPALAAIEGVCGQAAILQARPLNLAGVRRLEIMIPGILVSALSNSTGAVSKN